MIRVLLMAALLGCLAFTQADDAGQKVMRAVASLNGVFSPRGFFNITVRLYQLPGVDSAKFDLKKSRITLDFKPGVTVTAEDIQGVMKSAGYKPGPVQITQLDPGEVSETGPGWMKIKHPASHNPVIRWFQLNF
jgi:copper chaperone CopZ